MRQFRRTSFIITLFLSVSLAGCGLVSNSSPKAPASPPTITSISLSPQNSAVTIGKSLQFQAMATLSDGTQKDITSTATWACSNTAVATIQGGLVKGVGPGVVQIGAQSGSLNMTTLVNVTSQSFSNASLNGRYAFTLTSNTAQGLEIETGSITADGNGNLTGIEDLNAAGAVTTNVSITATYSITHDGRGTLTLKTGGGQSSRTLRFVLSANSSAPGDNNGTLIEFDGASTATGALKKQDSSAFQNSALGATTYIFRWGGLDTNRNPSATVGAFTTDATGANIASGQEDVNDNGSINEGTSSSTPLAITGGAIGTIDSSTGRATVALTANGHTSNLIAYVISASELGIIGVDSSAVLAGVAEKQASPAPASLGPGGYVFHTEIGGTAGQFWIMGQFQLNSTSAVTSVSQFQDGGITLSTAAPPGTASMGTSGRGALIENTSDGMRAFTLYMVSPTRMFLLETDDAHAAAGAGDMQQPGADGFGAATLNNSLALGAAEVADGNVAFVAGIVADGFGNLSGLEDVSQPQPGNPSKLATSTVAFGANYGPPLSNGVAIANVTTPNTGIQAIALFFISPNKALVLGLSPSDVTGTVTLQ